MYPDSLYNFLHANPSEWILIAIGYAIFDYLFNLIMCMITGGIQSTRKKTQKQTRLSQYKVFIEGGKQRIKEFRSDFLSWFWPLTILAIPVALLGITRWSLTKVLNSLSSINIQISKYQFLPNTNNIQFGLWGLALLSGLYTVYRYKYRRSKPTWFSKFTIFSLARAILFDTPIGYAVLNVILLMVSFSFTLYRILLDNTIPYNVFHLDQMYGLKTSYNAIVGMSIALVIISFLPTVILAREKSERYNTIYKLGVYSGIITTFIVMGILIYQFGQRLESIQNIALQSDLLSPLKIMRGDIQTLTALTYYNIASNFPDKFPFPTWLSSLLSIRAAVLGYELFRLFSVDAKDLSIVEVAKSLISKLQ